MEGAEGEGCVDVARGEVEVEAGAGVGLVGMGASEKGEPGWGVPGMVEGEEEEKVVVTARRWRGDLRRGEIVVVSSDIEVMGSRVVSGRR